MVPSNLTHPGILSLSAVTRDTLQWGVSAGTAGSVSSARAGLSHRLLPLSRNNTGEPLPGGSKGAAAQPTVTRRHRAHRHSPARPGVISGPPSQPGGGRTRLIAAGKQEGRCPRRRLFNPSPGPAPPEPVPEPVPLPARPSRSPVPPGSRGRDAPLSPRATAMAPSPPRRERRRFRVSRRFGSREREMAEPAARATERRRGRVRSCAWPRCLHRACAQRRPVRLSPPPAPPRSAANGLARTPPRCERRASPNSPGGGERRGSWVPPVLEGGGAITPTEARVGSQHGEPPAPRSLGTRAAPRPG